MKIREHFRCKVCGLLVRIECDERSFCAKHEAPECAAWVELHRELQPEPEPSFHGSGPVD